MTSEATGAPDVSVRSFGAGFGGSGGNGGTGGSGAPGGNGSGGPGSGTPGGPGSGGFGAGGPGSGGFGGAGGSGARRGAAVTGVITALQHGSITIQTATGTSRTLTLTSSTAVYRVVPATLGRLRPGLFTAVGSAIVNGRQVATVVVQASTSGATTTIVTSRSATPAPGGV